MSECTICYDQRREDDFFTLTCCHEKQICSACLRCLVTPQCPYCRGVIPQIKDDPRYRMAHSAPSAPSYMMMERTERIESRILRRQMKRLRKLEMREEDRALNRIFHHRDTV